MTATCLGCFIHGPDGLNPVGKEELGELSPRGIGKVGGQGSEEADDAGGIVRANGGDPEIAARWSFPFCLGGGGGGAGPSVLFFFLAGVWGSLGGRGGGVLRVPPVGSRSCTKKTAGPKCSGTGTLPCDQMVTFGPWKVPSAKTI